MLTGDYLKKLQKRANNSRISRKFQLVGLEISLLLEDPEHKALYIKLAKENDSDMLMNLAKEISRKKNIDRKGAYFMKVLSTQKQEAAAAKVPTPQRSRSPESLKKVTEQEWTNTKSGKLRIRRKKSS